MSAVKQLFRSLFSKEVSSENYQWKADSEGLTFFMPPTSSEKIKQGQANLWLANQHIVLTMLVEQGQAEAIPNGFIVPTQVVVNLDEIAKEALELPRIWDGHIKSSFNGQTFKPNFSINLKLETAPTQYTGMYELTGPILVVGDQEYLQTPGQELVFSALAKHQKSERSEADNLHLVMAVQEAQASGLNLTLPVFDKMELMSPEKITIAVETDEDGNLTLTPNLGQKATHEQIQQVLGQLRRKDSNVVRVGNEIILLDEKRLRAVHEILKNRKVPKDKIKEFYKTPSAFIDASLIELDVGFSARVKGAAYFKHAYFGATEESGISWFEVQPGTKDTVLPINQLIRHIYDEEDLREAQKKWDDAKQTGSQVLQFKQLDFDIFDHDAVEQAFADIQQALEAGDLPDPGDEGVPPISDDGTDVTDSDPTPLPTNVPGGDGTGSVVGGSDPEPAASIVVDPEKNDEIVGHNVLGGEVENEVAEKIAKISYPHNKLDWLNYTRQPYPHQKSGVSWIVGLAMDGQHKNKDQWGGLLADDMGLGKTFMALAAIDQLYKIKKQPKEKEKPCLIVAPLSVLENWKDEVGVTFSKSPFNDIIILQSASDMKRFRIGGKETKQDFSGVETEQDLPEEGQLAKIRYSLKVGDDYNFDERLDQPGRLVITTYQTLRDYQFSLCKINWSMVVFDEAQNIKNPNAMQTLAAKGLNSEFNLLVTGTPVENTLADFWCLMDTAVPGLLGSYQDFRQNYINPIIQAPSDEVDEERIRIGKLLRRDAGVFMLRRIKEDNLKGLPDKIISVGLESEQSDWCYDPRLHSTMQGFQKDSYDGIILANNDSDSNEALANLNRLRDVSLHPYLTDKGRLAANQGASQAEVKALLNDSAKLASLLKILDAVRDKQEKCIIFCINKQLQQFLSLALGSLYQLGVLSVINGDTKTVDNKNAENTRKGLIAAFEAKTGFNIIIMSPIAAGVGLTVVGANHAVHLERHWNPAKEAQASDRIYRIGQQKDAYIYIPILHHPDSDSFDVNLHKLLSKKTLLKDAVVTVEQVLPEMPAAGINVNRRLSETDLSKLSWQQFEALCAELFTRNLEATNCWLTNLGKDKGADAVLMQTTGATLLQCKHQKNSTYSGYAAIQEVKSAEPIYADLLGQEVINLFFVTNAKKVSSDARKVAKVSGVKIFTYSDLAGLLEAHVVEFSDVYSRLEKKRLSSFS